MPRPPVVSVRSDFCPLCYRGVGLNEKVPYDDPRIDQEQRECSRALGGLPLLDLAREGRRCSEGCKLVCLACGNPMAFPSEREFQDALDTLEKHEEELEETRQEVVVGMRGFESLGQRMLEEAEVRLQGRLKRMGMALHPRWRRLVHARCLRKAGCGCLIAVGVTACGKHQDVPIVVVKKKKPQVKKEPSPKKESKEAEEPPRIIASSPVVMRKADWLKPLSETVKVPVHTPPPPVASHPRPVRVIHHTKRIDPRLEKAAAGSARLDGWMNPASGLAALEPKQKDPFNRKRFERDFDPYQHGFFVENGVNVYRFPDGTKQRVSQGVLTMTDDGQFVSTEEPAADHPTPKKKSVVPKKAGVGEKKAHQRLRDAAKGCSRLGFVVLDD